MNADDRSAGSALRVALWSGAAALAVRLVAAVQEVRSAFFGLPILDEKYYDGAARTLLGWPGGVVVDGFRPLGYPGFLAAVYRLAGPDGGPAAAILVQHLLGVATGVLVALSARRWARSEGAGLAAGSLWALAGPPLFFEGQLLATTLFTFLMFLQIWVVTARASVGRRALAGGLTGLLARVRPNGLLLGVAYLAALLREKRRRRARLAAAALATLAVVYLVGSLAEVPWTRVWVPLSASGGVNLYLGNERGADGLVPRQDESVPAGEEYVDSVEAWSIREFTREGPAVSSDAAPGAVSRYWVGRTVREIGACPTCWLRLMGRKAVALVAGVEVPNHRSYAFTARDEMPLLRWLPARWWFLVAAAPLGLLALWRKGCRDAVAWGVTFAMLHAVGVLAFFVNSRYRIPLWPLACTWAGVGYWQLGLYLRGRAWRRLVPAVTAVVALGAVSWSASALLPLPGEGRDYFYRSMARQRRGLLEGSLSDARAAVATDARDPAYRVQLGNLLLALERYGEAIPELKTAVELDPRQPISYNNLGVALEGAGQVEAARAAYRSALRRDPRYLSAQVNLALLELSQGRIDAAEAALSGASFGGEADARTLTAVGLLALAKGECASGEELLGQASVLDRDAVDAIVTAVRSSGRWPPGVC